MKTMPTRKDCPTCKHLKELPIIDGVAKACTEIEGIWCDEILDVNIVMCDNYKRKEEGDD